MRPPIAPLITLLFFISNGFSNNYCDFGANFSYSTQQLVGMGLQFQINKNVLGFGGDVDVGYQPVYTSVEPIERNGLTYIGNHSVRTLFTISYCRIVTHGFSLTVEISPGIKDDVATYRMLPYKQNYNYLVDSKKLVGFGIKTGYRFFDFLEMNIGYNTLKKITFGIGFYGIALEKIIIKRKLCEGSESTLRQRQEISCDQKKVL